MTTMLKPNLFDKCVHKVVKYETDVKKGLFGSFKALCNDYSEENIDFVKLKVVYKGAI